MTCAVWLWSKCQDCREKCNLHRHKRGFGPAWKLTLCNLRCTGCITTGGHFHRSSREAEVLNLFGQVQHIQRVGVSSPERNNGLRTAYNIRADIYFSWSGYSIQHIQHSCTVTWLSPADPHPDVHTTIKTRASCEPAAPAQWGRQPELLKCLSVQLI